MFALSATTRVYLRSDATDLQLSFDGLYALVVGVLKADPLLCVEPEYAAAMRKHAAKLLIS